MFALVIVMSLGVLLLTGLFLQERSDLYKEIDSLKVDLIQAELKAEASEQDWGKE
jgi:hypothetical protein